VATIQKNKEESNTSKPSKSTRKLENQTFTETLFLTQKQLESLIKIVGIYKQTCDEWITSSIKEAVKEIAESPESWNVGFRLQNLLEAKTEVSLQDIKDKHLKLKCQVRLTLNQNQIRVLESLAACLNETNCFFIYDIAATRVRSLMEARIDDVHLTEHFTVQEALEIYQAWEGKEKYVFERANPEMAAINQSH
jgi:hypothetical protein